MYLPWDARGYGLASMPGCALPGSPSQRGKERPGHQGEFPEFKDSGMTEKSVRCF